MRRGELFCAHVRHRDERGSGYFYWRRCCHLLPGRKKSIERRASCWKYAFEGHRIISEK